MPIAITNDNIPPTKILIKFSSPLKTLLFQHISILIYNKILKIDNRYL